MAGSCSPRRARDPLGVDAAGLTAVVVRGPDGTAAFTVDLTGIAGLALAIEAALHSLRVMGLSEPVLFSGDGARLRLDSLVASLTFLAPRLAALVESSGSIAMSGTLTLAGADLTVRGRSITVEAGTTLDTRGADRDGDDHARRVRRRHRPDGCRGIRHRDRRAPVRRRGQSDRRVGEPDGGPRELGGDGDTSEFDDRRER